MSFIRRLVSALLLLALVPSFVLAAMPLKYCASNAGHQSLEIVIGSVAHSGDDVSHRDVLSEAVDVDNCGEVAILAEEESCNDSDLMKLAPAPGIAHLEFPDLPLVQYPAPLLSDGLATSYSDRAFSQPYPDPRISMRRTTVLRI